MGKWGEFGVSEQLHASLIVILFIAYAYMIHRIRVSKPKDFFDNAPSPSASCVKDKSCDTWINQSTFEYDLGPDSSLEIATSFTGFLLGVLLSSFVESYVLKVLSKDIFGLSFLFISCALLIWGMYYAGLFQRGNGNSLEGKYAYLMYPMLGAFIIICERTVTKIFDRIGHRGDFEYRTEKKIAKIMGELGLTNKTEPDTTESNTTETKTTETKTTETKTTDSDTTELPGTATDNSSESSSSEIVPKRFNNLNIRSNSWFKMDDK